MRVELGERRVLLGTNGAGKTTLFDVIAGDLSATQGKVALFGGIWDRPRHSVARAWEWHAPISRQLFSRASQ